MDLCGFHTWLDRQLYHRGWCVAEMAERSGLSDLALGRYLRGQGRPNVKNCQTIAGAFNLPVALVVAIAYGPRLNAPIVSRRGHFDQQHGWRQPGHRCGRH
jgi:transcriptional regulator with XRE-family HTH domain